ncbi:hypothetical protein GCM10023169_31110 [Georgenia halophila]|uniref:Endonuclease/exonuclease/phosphatase domain-containing protein n=1 Tax=Georgenia halophila TaxID=620889 RepID=A0ABP8LHN8_9MICO
MRIVGWVLVVLVAVAAALTLKPDLAGAVVPSWGDLSVTFPFSQAIAVRILPAAVFGIIAVIVLVVGLVRKFGFRAGNHSLVLALVLALVAVGHFWFLWDRGLQNPEELRPDRGVRPAGEGDGTITVVSYNTQVGRTGADGIAGVAEDTGADVIALTETGPELAEQIASFLEGGGESFQVFTSGEGDGEGGQGDPEGDEQDAEQASVGATALLVSSTLGEYAQAESPATEFGSVRAEPASGVGPVLVVVHAVPPLREQHERWRADLETILELCSDSGPGGLVLAGDFNATLDHAPMQDLGRCADAGVAAEVGGVSTWPTRLPELVGSPIDHVLVDTEAYETTQGRVVERGESDHRGLVMRIRPLEPRTD